MKEAEFQVQWKGIHQERIRDKFAAAALQGMLAAGPAPGSDWTTDRTTLWHNPDIAARWAYEFADAMLEAREGGE